MSQLTGYDVTTGVEPTTTTTAPNATEAPSTTTQSIPTPTTTAAAPQPGAVPVAPTQAATTSTLNTAAPTEPEATPSIEKNDPEPQNALTQRFTTEEWTVLKDFRNLLPQIFEDSFPDDPKAKDTPITIWGVQIDPQHPHHHAKVSVILMKFLRARNLNVSAARDMLSSTLRWRALFNIESALEEKFPQDLFGPMGHVFGKDKEGRPVMYNLYGAQDPKKVFADVNLFLRWRVSLQERLMHQLDFETVDQTLQIHDYAGVSITSRDANSKSAAAQATGIFQDYYPEVLHKKFFINVPTLLNWIFWAFKSMISPNTLAKMVVVGTGTRAIHKALSPHIDDSQLPKRYGGATEGF